MKAVLRGGGILESIWSRSIGKIMGRDGVSGRKGGTLGVWP